MYARATVLMRRSEDSFLELVLSSHHLGSRAYVISPGSKPPYPLSLLDDPGTELLRWWCYLLHLFTLQKKMLRLSSLVQEGVIIPLGSVSFKFKSWSAELGGSTGVLQPLVSFLL